MQKNIPFLLLVFVMLYAVGTMCLWLNLNTAPPWGMDIEIVHEGIDLYSLFKAGDMHSFVESLFGTSCLYSRIIAFFYFLYYVVCGIDAQHVLCVRSVFLIIGLWGIYKIGEVLFDKYCGVVAAFIFATLPSTAYYFKSDFREFPMMCVIAATVYYLLVNKGFLKLRPSILSGFWGGIALLIKWEAAIILFFPVLHAMFAAYYKSKSVKKILMNISASVLSGAIVVAPFVIVNFGKLSYFMRQRFLLESKDIFISLNGNVDLFRMYFGCLGMGYLLVALVICAAIFVYGKNSAHREYMRKMIYLLWCVVLPLSVFALLNQKNNAHCSPTTVFVALFLAAGLRRVKPFMVRAGILCCVLVYGIYVSLLPFEIDYGIHPSKKRTHVPFFHLMENIPSSFIIKPLFFLSAYDWEYVYAYMMEVILKDYAQQGKQHKPKVLLVVHDSPLKTTIFEYYNKRNGNALSIYHNNHESIDGKQLYENPYAQLIEKNIFDYIILKTPHSAKTRTDVDTFIANIVEAIKTYKYEFNQVYTEIKAIPIEHDSTIHIMRRNKQSIVSNEKQ